MKVKEISTGKVHDVISIRVSTRDDYNDLYDTDDLVVISDSGTDWEKVRVQAAIAAMQGLLTAPSYHADRDKLQMIAVDSVNIADALVKELKGE